MITLEVKQDGKIYVIKDCPENHNCMNGDKKRIIECIVLSGNNCLCSRYESALASCERIPVANHNDAFFRIQDQYMPKGAKEFKLVPGIYQVDCEWEEKEYLTRDGKDVDMKVAILKESPKEVKPNFVAIVSDHFNGGAGDTATLYDVAKFLEKLYTEYEESNHDPKYWEVLSKRCK